MLNMRNALNESKVCAWIRKGRDKITVAKFPDNTVLVTDNRVIVKVFEPIYPKIVGTLAETGANKREWRQIREYWSKILEASVDAYAERTPVQIDGWVLYKSSAGISAYPAKQLDMFNGSLVVCEKYGACAIYHTAKGLTPEYVGVICGASPKTIHDFISILRTIVESGADAK